MATTPQSQRTLRKPSAKRRPATKAPARVRVRDSDATKEKIGQAALREFTDKGYEGTTISMVARRADVSKQLLCHHFPTKEDLFRAVHNLRFREQVDQETIPLDPADLMAERFRARAKDIDYVRFLTWEAASGQDREIPGRDARLHRIIEKASAIKELQRRGKIPTDLDHRLLQLAITSLATYPLAFRQITRLITGSDPKDEDFQQAWSRFLRQFGQLVFGTKASKSRRATRP